MRILKVIFSFLITWFMLKCLEKSVTNVSSAIDIRMRNNANLGPTLFLMFRIVFTSPFYFLCDHFYPNIGLWKFKDISGIAKTMVLSIIRQISENGVDNIKK